MRLCRTIALIFFVGAVLSIPGCIMEDNKGCVWAIDVSFFSQTICQPEHDYPPEIEDLLICVFDGDGVLVDYRHKNDVTIGPAYFERFDMRRNGTYSVAAWSGIADPLFAVGELTVGGTRKDDLLFRLKRSNSRTTLSENTVVYYGDSPGVYVAGSKRGASNTTVNLKEVTNRLTVVVEGLLANPEDYEICVESDDGSMTLGGRIADDEVIMFDPFERIEQVRLTACFAMLKLEPEHVNILLIRNVAENEVVFEEDLLETLLLKNPGIYLECDHDFVIRLTGTEVAEDGTYMITEIRVNEWLVYSYEWEGN